MSSSNDNKYSHKYTNTQCVETLKQINNINHVIPTII